MWGLVALSLEVSCVLRVRERHARLCTDALQVFSYYGDSALNIPAG
jgi:hypothetical protein